MEVLCPCRPEILKIKVVILTLQPNPVSVCPVQLFLQRDCRDSPKLRLYLWVGSLGG